MRKRFSFGSSAASTTATTRSSDTTSSPSSVTPSPLVPTTFSDNLPLPSIFVFDLDYTLWPFWVDTHCSPPLKPVTTSPSSSEVTKLRDRHGEDFGFYTTVPPILWAARQRGITMSIASRTHAPQLADAMLRSLTISAPPPPPPPAAAAAPAPSSGPASSDTGLTSTPSMPPNAFFNNSNNNYKGGGGNYSSYDESQSRSKGKPIKAIAFFTAPQIYPGSKVAHLKKIQALVPASASASSSSLSSSTGGGSGGIRRSLMSPSPAPSLSSTTSKKRRSMAILGGGGSSRKNKDEKAEEEEEEKHEERVEKDSNNNNNKKTSSSSTDGKVPFEDMIFFDDEARNRNVETELGVTFVLVRDGLTRDEVDRGVWEWRRRRLGIVQKNVQQSRNTKDSSSSQAEAAGNGAAANGFVEMEG